jgi:hypothetical protein
VSIEVQVKRNPVHDDGVLIDGRSLLLALAEHLAPDDAEQLREIAERVDLEFAIPDDLLR